MASLEPLLQLERVTKTFYTDEIETHALENPMVVLKVLLTAKANSTQAGRDRAFSPGQQGAEHKDFGAFPSWIGEGRGKNYNQFQQIGR